MNKNFHLIKARKMKGFSQEVLAKLMNCEKTTISNWENGYSTPKLSDAFKLSIILEQRLEQLFFGLKVQVSQTYKGGELRSIKSFNKTQSCPTTK